MKKIKIVLFALLFVFTFSCDKESLSKKEITLASELPGDHIVEMEINAYNAFYFITSEVDDRIEVPGYSSYIPFRYYLSRRESENSVVEILDDDYAYGGDILFDLENNMWSRTSSVIYKKEGDTYTKVIELSEEEGYFKFFTLDKENNIWAGGYADGLYKIEKDLDIIKYTPQNSNLPHSSMIAMHIDAYNNKWIALGNNRVLKIEGDNWQHFSPDNSNISLQRIWCLTTDKNGHLWIGTGWSNLEVSLMKFDSQTWTLQSPFDEDNTLVRGTVRKLFSDHEKIYVVSETTDNMAFDSNILLTYDGENWDRIEAVPEDDIVADIKIDYSRNVAWVRMQNQGIISVDL